MPKNIDGFLFFGFFIFGVIFSLSGLEGVIWVQKHKNLDLFMEWATFFGDPKNILHIVIPVICCIIPVSEESTIFTMMIVIVQSTSDSLNAYLKWPLAGDRPYWLSELVIQFPMTCETGFGMPSGHVMVSTAVLTLFCLKFPKFHYLRIVAFFVVIGVCFSRVHTGAHLPSQSVWGAVCGLVTSWGLFSYLNLDIICQRWLKCESLLTQTCQAATAGAGLVAMGMFEFAFLR